MKVVEIKKPGGPEVLYIGSRPVPKPKKNEVLIKVKAAGINKPDIYKEMVNILLQKMLVMF